MQAVILAGGTGVRLGKISKKLPKVLVKVGNKPIIEHQILLLKRYGIRNIWVLSGYLSDQVVNFLQNGKKWGCKIRHLIEAEDDLLGSGGALKNLEGKIKKDFLVLSGDIMLDIDFDKFISFHKGYKNQIASIIVHPSDHPADSDLVKVDTQNRVRQFLVRKNKTQPTDRLYHNLTNTGIFIFSAKIFNYINKDLKSDIEKDIFPKILKIGKKIYAYNSAEYIKDIGTPKRLAKIQHDFSSGKIARLNRKNKRPAIFIDRDGTINSLIPDLSNIKDFNLLPESAKAIKKINQSDYLAIVITNQPQVAKGILSANELDQIHKKLETELGRLGAKIDAIYFCPHHPEKGFAREIKSLKINCGCRKPKIGLITKAAKNFNIDISKCYLVGDSTIDAKTAQNANLKFIGVETGNGLRDHKFEIEKPPIVSNLSEAVSKILLS